MDPRDPDSASVADARSSRFRRAKQVFLRMLVISLAVCATVAVTVLLAGTFSDLTARVLGTLVALAVHSGIAMACAELLETRRVPRLSAVGLVAFAINFCVLMTCVWSGLREGEGIITTIALIGAFLLAMPSASLLDSDHPRGVPLLGLLSCVVAFVMCMACIWTRPYPSEDLGRATGIVGIIAFTFAQMALLIRVAGRAASPILFRVAVGFAWLLAALASVAIAWEIDIEPYFRWLGAVGVVDASATLALLIVAKLHQSRQPERLETAVARAELRCPRCTMLQTLDAGPARCSVCGLKIRIDIEEPRCVQCNYLLWQLPDRRCPECGTTF